MKEEFEDLAGPKESRGRSIGNKVYFEMDFFDLGFEPYLSLAERCGMSGFGLMKSERRIYWGTINMGGHAAQFEIVPMTFEEVQDLKWLERMLENHGLQMHYAVGTAKYEI